MSEKYLNSYDRNRTMEKDSDALVRSYQLFQTIIEKICADAEKDSAYIWEHIERLGDLSNILPIIAGAIRKKYLTPWPAEKQQGSQAYSLVSLFNTLCGPKNPNRLLHASPDEQRKFIEAYGVKNWFAEFKATITTFNELILKYEPELRKYATRRGFLKAAAAGLLFGGVAQKLGAASPFRKQLDQFLTVSLSDGNDARPLREKTKYIILHTMEAPAKSYYTKGTFADIKLHNKANFMVAADGKIYQCIDSKRVANHAGESMWNGESGLNMVSVGIEVQGYHYNDILPAQYKPLKVLLDFLKKEYNIKDTCVLTHSMVACYYGTDETPGRKGRKRCGYRFAWDDVRKKLGLKPIPKFDPDVKAGRMVFGDEVLAKLLYGKQRPASVAQPDAKEEEDGPAEKEMNKLHTVGNIGKGNTPYSIAGNEYASATTIYILPSGIVKTGQELAQTKDIAKIIGKSKAKLLRASTKKDKENIFATLPPKTNIFVGYRYGGRVTEERSPYSIVGKEWNSPSTFYYRIHKGKFYLIHGPKINPERILKGTIVLFVAYRK